MRRTKKDADITRESLLSAALRVFSKKGYATTTLEDIAKEAGVTRGAIYWHFGGKVELYTSLVSERFGKAQSFMERMLSEADTRGVIETLRKFIVESLRLADEDEDYRAILELTQFKTEVSVELADSMKQKSKANRGALEYFTKMIQYGKDRGEVRSDVNPLTAALSLLALPNGVVMLWLIDNDIVSLKDVAEDLATLYIDSIAAKPSCARENNVG